MKRIVLALTFSLLAFGAAQAANLSLLSGPQPASQLTGILNGLIQQINTNAVMQSVNATGGLSLAAVANGTGTVSMTNVAPSGASSTPRIWLSFTQGTTTYYVPGF